MLAASPHRGSHTCIEILGQAALGVVNDPDWVTATIAREGERLAVFCGALDNETELWAELGEPPAVPTYTPATTLLAAFARWGEAAISRLRGSFAGAVTDGHSIRCFRDQFGARPLFHHDGATGFFAGTEVKQVLAGSSIRREPNLDHLHGVIFGGIARSTAYLGVERIPKSCIASVGPRPGVTFREYWDPARFVETVRLSAKAAAEGTVEALDRAVRRQLTGRDAILLSGGLDSPALAVFAARQTGLANPVRAVTAVYPEYPSVDERPWTQMAADHLGLSLHCYVARAGSLDDLGHWVGLLDGPVDLVSIPESAEAYREARALGARTVVNGEVAEFLFESRGNLLGHLLAHGRLGSAARVLGWSRERGRARTKLARDVVRSLSPGWLLAARRKRHPRSILVPPWIDKEHVLRAARGAAGRVRTNGPSERWIRLQTAPLRGPGIIGFEADEICAAACGVDSRRPFADVDLWEFVLSLPAEVKFPARSTKPLLRQAMRGLLPDALIDRTDKTLFNEFHVATADYPALGRILLDPPDHLKGIDYALLANRLRAADMPARELQWARDVARVHAFLEQWR